MTTGGIPVGPTACEGYAVDEATDTGYHVHCPGRAESASLREQLAEAKSARAESEKYTAHLLWLIKEMEGAADTLGKQRDAAEALALANGEARERAEAEVAKLRVDMEEMVEAAGRHTELDAKLERLADGLTENGRAIDAAAVARAERAEAERDESRGLLDRIVTAWDDDDISAATQHARLARLTGEARRFLASHPAAIPEGTPTDRK